jgi:hypothetical protein
VGEAADEAARGVAVFGGQEACGRQDVLGIRR